MSLIGEVLTLLGMLTIYAYIGCLVLALVMLVATIATVEYLRRK